MSFLSKKNCPNHGHFSSRGSMNEAIFDLSESRYKVEGEYLKEGKSEF